jgi:hypothetical protein
MQEPAVCLVKRSENDPLFELNRTITFKKTGHPCSPNHFYFYMVKQSLIKKSNHEKVFVYYLFSYRRDQFHGRRLRHQ